MEKVSELIEYTHDIIDGVCKDKHYNSIYFHSNEDLNSIFNEVDVSDKDVLTVLSSGDQALHMYDRGVGSVEFFDVNKLTLYYFYLRVWTIKYLNKFYPELYFKNNFLNKVLRYVKPETEEEMQAYLYWKKFAWHFSNINPQDLEEILMLGTNIFKNKIYDLSRVKLRLENENYKFYNIDISKKVNLEKKYDIIFVSNIGERIMGLAQRNGSIKNIEIYKNNLLNLLKEDGIVIATNVVMYGPKRDEMEVFSSNFVKQDLKSMCKFGKKKSPGYVYRKVR